MRCGSGSEAINRRLDAVETFLWGLHNNMRLREIIRYSAGRQAAELRQARQMMDAQDAKRKAQVV